MSVCVCVKTSKQGIVPSFFTDPISSWCGTACIPALPKHFFHFAVVNIEGVESVKRVAPSFQMLHLFVESCPLLHTTQVIENQMCSEGWQLVPCFSRKSPMHISKFDAAHDSCPALYSYVLHKCFFWLLPNPLSGIMSELFVKGPCRRFQHLLNSSPLWLP